MDLSRPIQRTDAPIMLGCDSYKQTSRETASSQSATSFCQVEEKLPMPSSDRVKLHDSVKRPWHGFDQKLLVDG
jgi:hypothetical protein